MKAAASTKTKTRWIVKVHGCALWVGDERELGSFRLYALAWLIGSLYLLIYPQRSVSVSRLTKVYRPAKLAPAVSDQSKRLTGGEATDLARVS